MPWKMENDQVVVNDGHPVWVYDDGKESPFDAGSALKQISSLTGESMSRKQKIREMEDRLKVLDGIEDPEGFLSQAKDAMSTIENLKDKELVDAGEVEKIKRGVSESYERKLQEQRKAFESQIEEKEGAIKAKDEGIHKLLVKGAFMQSDFLRNKTVLPPDLAFDSFGKFFKIEEVEGQPQAVAMRPNGDEIFSLREPGKYASADEAIEILISERKDKDSILRGTPPGAGTKTSMGSSSMSQSEMLKLSPIERLNAARRGQK